MEWDLLRAAAAALPELVQQGPGSGAPATPGSRHAASALWAMAAPAEPGRPSLAPQPHHAPETPASFIRRSTFHFFRMWCTRGWTHMLYPFSSLSSSRWEPNCCCMKGSSWWTSSMWMPRVSGTVGRQQRAESGWPPLTLPVPSPPPPPHPNCHHHHHHLAAGCPLGGPSRACPTPNCYPTTRLPQACVGACMTSSCYGPSCGPAAG